MGNFLPLPQRNLLFRPILRILLFAPLIIPGAGGQQGAKTAAIQQIDASVAAREENLMGYTVTERYRVFRNGDTSHAAAEMTVKTTYRKETGKSYLILSQTGSDLLLKEVLGRILDSERLMTQPANRTQAVLTSANYAMSPTANETVDGRNCLAVAITPKKVSPYLFKGRIWVDSHDGSIVKLDGIASKSPSMFTGVTRVSRQYENVNGFPMATHATAESESWLLGRTEIEIDYTGYDIDLRNPPIDAHHASPGPPVGSVK